MSDDPTGGRPPADDDEETRDPLAPPAPATYAGRQRQAGEESAEASGEEAAGEEAHAEEQHAEEQHAEEQHAEEQHAEEQHAEEQHAEEQHAEESVDAPAQEPAEEAAAEDEQQTLEADSLELGDREEAQEAALAAVRARAAKKETKLTAAAAPGAGDPGPRRGLWARFIAASALIVTSMATATALTGLLVLTDIARGLGDIPGVDHQLTSVDGGDPQTLLILGSDQRVGPEEDEGRSDTTLLLRLDPDQNEIRLLSLPRDLRVNIPGYGPNKLNSAYTEGGPSLTLKTVKQFTGMEINHVVNVDFRGFAEAVNEIDCVYIDVDRHYFISPEADVSEIDVEAGYQRLCGLKALQYVRYRHTDNDIVRAARQQDFLREARQKVPPSRLIDDRKDLTEIFTKHTESDIKTLGTLVAFLKTLFAMRNAPVTQIPFKGDIGGPDDPYVTASNEQIRKAVAQFLGQGQFEPEKSKPKKHKGKKGGGGEKTPEPPPAPSMPEMIDASGSGLLYAQAVADEKLKIPVQYPTRLVPGSTLSDASRSFPIDGPDDDVYRGYKLVVELAGDVFPEYYGVSGTNWPDPPILENPSETRVISGREYMLYYDGDRLRLVAWRKKKASYWGINTLTGTLSEAQMLAIAQSMQKQAG